MRALMLLMVVCCGTAVSSIAAAVEDEGIRMIVDERGVLRRLPVDGGWIDVEGGLSVPAQGWSRIDRFSASADLVFADATGARHWRGTMLDGGLRIHQQCARAGDGSDAWRITLDADERDGTAAHESTQWMLDLPSTTWAGGTWRIDDRTGTLPATLPAGSPHLDAGGGSRIELRSADSALNVVVTLPPGSQALLQDGRGWGQSFNLYLPLARGADGHWSLSYTIAATGTVDHAPISVVVGAETGHRIDGLGGNWCFAIDAPTTARSRALLPSSWARTEMDLSRLPEPPADAEPASWAATAVAALDEVDAGPERNHLALTGAFGSEHVPVMTSLWRAPDWMLEQPVREHGNRVSASRWRWFAACAVAWLSRARDHGGEPLCFSFNEPDWGVRIKLTPDEQRDAVVLLGAAFAGAGLRTKLAVGDVTNARDTLAYVRPSVEDPAARAFVACLAVHSWGGASAAQWGSWRAYASEHQLPLVIAEVGPDAEAWRDAAYTHRRYQLAEAEHLVGILRDARPDAALRWEFTGDYDLFDDGRPTMRYSVWRWALAALPKGASYRACASDSERVLTVAASVGDGATVLMTNTGWARVARIRGLPDGAYHLAVATPEAPWTRLPDAVVSAGSTRVDLPAEAFVVLTTAALPLAWDAPAR